MLFAVNQTVSLWCRANNTEVISNKLLQALFWQYPNGTKLPKVVRGGSSEHDVYRESFAGAVNSTYTAVWWSVLHFRRIQPSYGGTYKCVANYNKLFWNETVEVEISRR